MKSISSPDNRLFRQLRALMHSGRERSASGLAVLEGTHLVLSYLQATRRTPKVTVFCASEAAHPDLAQLAAALPPETRVIFTAKLFSRLSPVSGGNAVLSLVPIHAPSPEAVLRKPGLQVWLDGVQDPGNVGSIIRSAAAAGAAAVVLGPGCADAWAPKCLRGGMGGHFVIEVCQTERPLAAIAQGYEGRILAAAADAESTLYETDLAGTLAIALGSEGHGISRALKQLVLKRFRIPMREGVESLNVAAAAAVICFERVRQSTAVKS